MRNSTLRAAVLAILLLPAPARAIGINTNTGLTPSKGEYLWRTQTRITRATDEAGTATRRAVNTMSWENTLVHGVTPDLTLGFTAPYLSRGTTMTDAAGARVQQEAAGFGDPLVLGKYRFFQDDGRLFTSRLAAFGAVELPAGKADFSSRSYDVVLGPVYTLQKTIRDRFFEWDADVLYKYNSPARRGAQRGVKAGDILRYDASLQVQVFPGAFSDDMIFNAVLELNGAAARRSARRGASLPATGFHRVFLSPGVQVASRRFVIEAAVQAPVYRRSLGAQVEPDISFVLGMRFVF